MTPEINFTILLIAVSTGIIGGALYLSWLAERKRHLDLKEELDRIEEKLNHVDGLVGK